ncbi:MAG: hypothetical protein AAF532_14750 [Planctomycetota bacterium]
MPRRIDLRAAADPGDSLHEAVEALAGGQSVVMPTEVGYLPFWSAESAEVPADDLVLVTGGPVDTHDFLPTLGKRGLRLLHRVWPGPLSVSVPAPADSGGEDGVGLWPTLPPSVRERFSGRPVEAWCPGHPVPREVGRYLRLPLVTRLSADGGTAEPDESFPCHVVLDDGPVERRETITRLSWSDGSWRVTTEGGITADEIRQCLATSVLFVCTGNTCRSPLAEGIFRTRLAERFGVGRDDLKTHGVVVGSAGVAASYGAPASSESRALAEKHDYGIEDHASQGLTDELLDRADHVFVMTRRHQDMIVDARPDLGERVEMLARDGGDISDPIGGGPEAYEFCRRQIEAEVDAILGGWGARYGTEGGA